MKPGMMALFFRLAAPETIFVVVSSELSAGLQNRAGFANRARHLLALLAGLRSLGDGGEKYVGEPATCRIVHPLVVGLDSSLIKIKR